MNEIDPGLDPESCCTVPNAETGTDAYRENWDPIKRLALSLAVFVGVQALGFLKIPLISWGSASVLGGSAFQKTGSLAFLQLGITPLISAMVLVEIVALAVPGLRRLRHGGFEGRARLWKASFRLFLFFLALDAFLWSRMLKASHRIGEDGLSFVLIAAVLMIGPLLLLGAIRLVDRCGLGNGFSLVIVASIFSDLFTRSFAKGQLQSFENPSVLMVGLAVIVLLPVLTYRIRIRSEESLLPRSLPIPTCGLQPFLFASTVGVLLMRIIGDVADLLGIGPLPWLHKLMRLLNSPGIFSMTGMLSLLALAVTFSILFNRPKHLIEAWRRICPDQEPELKRNIFRMLLAGTAFSLAFIALLVILQGILNREHIILNLPFLVILICVGMDLVKEWRFRNTVGSTVAVWPLHRVHAVLPALSALETASIPAHPRGFHHRSLLHFFGPMIPIEIQVPKKHEEEARQKLQELFG